MSKVTIQKNGDIVIENNSIDQNSVVVSPTAYFYKSLDDGDKVFDVFREQANKVYEIYHKRYFPKKLILGTYIYHLLLSKLKNCSEIEIIFNNYVSPLKIIHDEEINPYAIVIY